MGKDLRGFESTDPSKTQHVFNRKSMIGMNIEASQNFDRLRLLF